MQRDVQEYIHLNRGQYNQHLSLGDILKLVWIYSWQHSWSLRIHWDHVDLHLHPCQLNIWLILFSHACKRSSMLSNLLNYQLYLRLHWIFQLVSQLCHIIATKLLCEVNDIQIYLFNQGSWNYWQLHMPMEEDYQDLLVQWHLLYIVVKQSH